MDTKKLKEELKPKEKICIPGMRLSPANHNFIAGPGTNELNGYIYANLAGVLKMTKDEETNSKVSFGML